MPLCLLITLCEDGILTSYRTLLAREGHEVIAVRTLAEATTILEERGADVVVVDPDLPCTLDDLLTFVSQCLEKDSVRVLWIKEGDDQAESSLPFSRDISHLPPPHLLAREIKSILER